MKMKYGIYRKAPDFWGAGTYRRLIRDGEHVQFRTKREAKKWLKENPPYSKIGATFEVKKLYKGMFNEKNNL